ncbi:DUF397 domain-containing protein [Streptomyces albidus (ex Kaewkla and Franco 2022)]|uniref:DUF397 domain-containing protein n=1 Tax=Streptomyces albidus (ex Kaewkla and Franco 2022) TaxID=722709 RepID=UPI0015EE9210|nr:DUF397 domain-containing protein [Streptomyces albidus (ex Kaewkla and Franco 2022)]
MTLKPSASDGPGLEWIKSTHSGSDNNDCVETATTTDAVHVRDSKDKQGPQLDFTRGAWTRFVAHARA